MVDIYITKSGDMWDRIALSVYGSEKHVSHLMKNNQKLLKYFVFPEGIELKIVELPKEESTLPDWRS